MFRILFKYIPWFLRRYLKRVLGIPDVWNNLNRLKENGFDPQIILDVGAFDGNWTKDCKRIFPHSVYYLIEPQDKLSNVLKRMENDTTIYHNLLFGSEDGIEVDFYVSGTSSSILRFDTSSPISRKTTRIDTFCRNSDIGKIDLLKLDVQGYELEILKGSKNILNRTNIVVTEVSLIDVYKDCPLVSQIILYLDSQGFQLYDIADFRRRELDNSLWQCDMFFIKKDDDLLLDKRKDHKQLRPR